MFDQPYNRDLADPRVGSWAEAEQWVLTLMASRGRPTQATLALDEGPSARLGDSLPTRDRGQDPSLDGGSSQGRGYGEEVDGVRDLFGAIAWTAVLCIPLGISLWALLDCAKRPGWAWALAGRRQVVWMAVILMGFISVVGGLAISTWYLTKVRPVIARAEGGVGDL